MSSPTIILGISGSIAACKTPEIVSELRRQGCAVHVAMTPAAPQFVTPLTLQTLSQNPVALAAMPHLAEGWRPLHIDFADRADLLLIAPATANILAALAHGFAHDPVTEIALATRAPILIAPAMNGKMWDHVATRANVDLLRSRGVHFVAPDTGLLACGYEGIGRLAPVAQIVEAARALLPG